MDIYGHLFPGQELEAVGQLHEMLAIVTEALWATGMDDAVVPNRQNQHNTTCSSYDVNRCTNRATGCDERPKPFVQKKRPSRWELPTQAMGCNTMREWSGPELNWRHADFQSAALPTELPDQMFHNLRCSLRFQVQGFKSYLKRL